MYTLKAAAKVQKNNDIHKSVCHFFADFTAFFYQSSYFQSGEGISSITAEDEDLAILYDLTRDGRLVIEGLVNIGGLRVAPTIAFTRYEFGVRGSHQVCHVQRLMGFFAPNILCQIGVIDEGIAVMLEIAHGIRTVDFLHRNRVRTMPSDEHGLFPGLELQVIIILHSKT